MRVVGFVLLLVLTGCSGQNDAPLRIGVNPWPGYVFFHVAAERGLFDDEGVAVDLVELESLRDVRAAFAGGSLDGMGSTVVEVLQVYATAAVEPVVCALADVSLGGDVLIVDAQISSLEDLRGAVLAVEPGTTSHVLAVAAIEAAGLRTDEVELVALPLMASVEAFAAGEIDGAVAYGSTRSALLARGGRELFSSADVPGLIVDVISFERRVLERRADDVVAVLRAYERARRWAMENPDESLPLISRWTDIEVDELRHMFTAELEVVPLTGQSDRLDAEALRPVFERSRSALGADPSFPGPLPVDPAPLRALVASWSSDASASTR